MYGKNVLVAGSTGFIGYNLTERLLSVGANVRGTGFSRKSSINHPNFEYFQCDLTLTEDCDKSVKDMEYVFLCAATTSGSAVICSTPMVHVTPNMLINSQMLDSAYKHKIKKFLWISSACGYALSNKESQEDDMFYGDDPYEKYYFGGWMKRFTEILCNMYSKLDRPMPCIVLRPTNIYGPHDKFDFERCHVFPALIRRVVERHDPLGVWGDGNDIRDFIYVDDVVDAIMLAMEKINRYDPINIGSGITLSIKELLKTILSIESFDPDIEFDTLKPSTIPICKVNTNKAKEVLGFSPQIDLHEGINKTLSWYKDNKNE